MEKNKTTDISVTDLRAKLLEIVRGVERGKSYRITKGKKPVAILGPIETNSRPLFGFANVAITGDLLEPIPETFTFDSDNIA